MNYEDFYKKITLPTGLRIAGWPTEVPFQQPGKISDVDLARALLECWENGTIQFVKATPLEKKRLGREYAARLKERKAVKKVREDKGKQRVGVLTPEEVPEWADEIEVDEPMPAAEAEEIDQFSD